MALSSKKQKVGSDNLVPVLAARAPLPKVIWVHMRSLSQKEAEELGVDTEKGHLFLARVAMGLLTDEWYHMRDPWDEDPELSAMERFCLAHGVYHAWLSEDGAAMEWAMDMCLNIDKLYWWLCAARHENDLEKVVEDLKAQQEYLPGIKLMASLVRLSKRAIARDQRQWAGQVLGRLEAMDLTRHAFLSGARRLLGKKPDTISVLMPRDEGVSGLEPAGGAVVDVLHIPTNTGVAYSPDGLQLASGAYDKKARIWDTRTGRVLHVLEGHTHWVNSVAFSPDGFRLASASGDKTVRIWDANSGKMLQVLEGHPSIVWRMAYSPDGFRLASASGDKTVRIWDAQSGHMLSMLEGHTDWVNSVAYSPDGHHLASASDDRTVRIWDALTGKILQVLEGHTYGVNSVAYSPDGRYVASGSRDKTVRIWDTQTGHMLHMWEGHTEDITSVAYAPDGLRLASASHDKTVRIWDARPGEMLHTLEGHTGSVHSVAFSRDGFSLASASWDDDTVRIWDTSAFGAVRRKKMKEIQGDSSQVIMSFTSHNVTTVSFTFDNYISNINASLNVEFGDSGLGVSLKIV